jgi:hypothetical protein
MKTPSAGAAQSARERYQQMRSAQVVSRAANVSLDRSQVAGAPRIPRGRCKEWQMVDTRRYQDGSKAFAAASKGSSTQV